MERSYLQVKWKAGQKGGTELERESVRVELVRATKFPTKHQVEVTPIFGTVRGCSCSVFPLSSHSTALHFHLSNFQVPT